jgi:hypothetical protein
VKPRECLDLSREGGEGLINDQAFTMYGYDAGVLGGVQATKPFLDAIGVRALKAIIFP